MYCASLQSSSPVPGGRCELVWWSLIGPSWAQEMTHHQHVARTPGYHNVAAASHTCNIVGHLKFMSWLCYQVTKVLKLALMVTPSQTEPHGFAFPLPVELRLRWTWCQSTTHNVYQPLQTLFGPLITTTDGLATFSTLYKHFISLRFTFNWVTLLSWKCKDQLCWADLLSGVSLDEIMPHDEFRNKPYKQKLTRLNFTPNNKFTEFGVWYLGFETCQVWLGSTNPRGRCTVTVNSSVLDDVAP